MIRILLAEQHVLVRQGVRALLEREVAMEVVGEAGDGWEAVELAREQRPHVAVLDVDLPALNGVEAISELKAVSPATRSILLTSRSEDRYVLRALQAGASGYVLKIQASEDLVRALREVSAGRVYLSPSVSRGVVQAYLAGKPTALDPLTARERQLLQLVAEGKSTKEAAALMGIRAKTGESHRTRMMTKLDVHSTAGLVRYAIRVGLVRPSLCRQSREYLRRARARRAVSPRVGRDIAGRAGLDPEFCTPVALEVFPHPPRVYAPSRAAVRSAFLAMGVTVHRTRLPPLRAAARLRTVQRRAA